MSKLGLITIHGMGSTPLGYADNFFEDLKDRLGPSWSRIKNLSVYYQDILEFNQEDYWARVDKKVDWDKLRRFVLFGFSDAASLETQKQGEASPYYQSQKRILDTMRGLYHTLGPETPAVIIAQSLGGQVLSNYLWDAQKEALGFGAPGAGVWSHPLPGFSSPAEEQFCRGKMIHRLYTTGCNIPIFVAGRSRDKIKAIQRPNNSFEWHNYYDNDDVLGWPLRDLRDSYANLVQEYQINAGLLAGPTPFSHTKYWSDRDFLKPLTDYLRSMV